MATIKLAIKATASHRIAASDCLTAGIIIMQRCWPGHFGHLADRPSTICHGIFRAGTSICRSKELSLSLFTSRHARYELWRQIAAVFSFGVCRGRNWNCASRHTTYTHPHRERERESNEAACDPFTCLRQTKDLGNELASPILHISAWKVLGALLKVLSISDNWIIGELCHLVPFEGIPKKPKQQQRQQQQLQSNWMRHISKTSLVNAT